MKTLYESILRSTNSGKYKKIDVDYLLKHDFEPDARYGRPKTMLKHKETGYSLRIDKDKIVLDVIDDDVFDMKTLVVSTIEDLDLVIEWFKECKDDISKTSDGKLRKAVFKKLKEL